MTKKGKISLKILQTSPKRTQFIFEFGGFSQILPKNVLESRQRKVETTGMHLVKEVAKVSILSVPGNARQFRWMGYTMSLNYFCTCILISTPQFSTSEFERLYFEL